MFSIVALLMNGVLIATLLMDDAFHSLPLCGWPFHTEFALIKWHLFVENALESVELYVNHLPNSTLTYINYRLIYVQKLKCPCIWLESWLYEELNCSPECFWWAQITHTNPYHDLKPLTKNAMYSICLLHTRTANSVQSLTGISPKPGPKW